jgi:hypothetical protein
MLSYHLLPTKIDGLTFGLAEGCPSCTCWVLLPLPPLRRLPLSAISQPQRLSWPVLSWNEYTLSRFRILKIISLLGKCCWNLQIYSYLNKETGIVKIKRVASYCLLLLLSFLVLWFFPPWWLRRYVPPKRRFSQEPYGVTSQKTVFFIVTAMKTSNLTKRR